MTISLRYVPESRDSEAKQIDWLGALLATAGLAGIVTAFLESARLGWSHPLVLAGLFGGSSLLAAFLATEARLRSPMVPLALFQSHAFLGANIFTLLLYATLGIFFFLFPMALIQEEGYSPTAAGSAMLPMILVMFFLSRWSGGLVKRYGGKIPLIVGPLIVSRGQGSTRERGPGWRGRGSTLHQFLNRLSRPIFSALWLAAYRDLRTSVFKPYQPRFWASSMKKKSLRLRRMERR